MAGKLGCYRAWQKFLAASADWLFLLPCWGKQQVLGSFNLPQRLFFLGAKYMGGIFAFPVLSEDYLGKLLLSGPFPTGEKQSFEHVGGWHGAKRHASTLRGFSESLAVVALAEWVIASLHLEMVTSR